MTDTDDTPSEITLRVMRDRDTHDGSIYDEAKKLRARIEQLEAAIRDIKGMCAGDRAPRWTEDGWAVTQSRGRILDICDGVIGPALAISSLRDDSK